MKTQAENGLIYDENDARCLFEVMPITDHLTIAFVQCYDPFSGHIKRYCGVYDKHDRENTINEIMLTGAKFDWAVKFWSERI
jgi:hypothetical protein